MLFNKKDKIGSYEVMFQHKEGSYAETYRVKDSNGQTRFLKIINHVKLSKEQVDDKGRVIEVEISKQLNHHNLCSYVDSGDITIKGCKYTYIVTEFISGETLAQRIIRENVISVFNIKKIAKSILCALDYIHNLKNPIVHGEITIQNIMLNLVGGYEDLKLIDFGHACFINKDQIKPNINDLNPFYIAPERFSGISQVQSDIYSVGVIMYYLLYGELPWFIDLSRVNGDKIEHLLSKREKPLKIPTTDIFELDNQLLNCIIKALSFNIEDRFQSAKEFIQAIEGQIKIRAKNTYNRVKADDSKNVTNKEKIQFSRKVEGPGFAAIAGMEELKHQMIEEVIEALHNPEEYRRYGISIPNGMVLYGPPGCGKTFFAKHFAEEAGFNFMPITPATLKSKWINATQENIAAMFKEAEENAPTVIFIDELDDLLKDRSLADDKGMSGINEFLAQMDRTGEKGIFIIGATNKPDILDPAVLRAGRLEKKYYLGMPDKPAREALFKLYLEKRPYDFGLDYGKLADMTENYVPADIQLIVNDASRAALKEHSKISMELLMSTIGKVKRSVSDKELKKYERIKAIMNGEIPDDLKRPKIGF